jgi:hypothetical protein
VKKLLTAALLLAFLLSLNVFAQEPEPIDPEPEPVQPKDEQKPGEPEQKPEADDGKIIIYLNIKDYTDKKPFKWRMIEFAIAETFRLANPEYKEKWKESQRKRHDWSKFSKKKMEQKIEKDYKDLRKRKGVDKLDYSHIKVIQWRPKPKEQAKEEKKEGEEKKKEEDESGETPHTPDKDKAESEEDGEEKEQEPDESGEEPHIPGGGDKKPDKEVKKPVKPAPKKKWVDPAETADFLIQGTTKFTKGKQTKYFGETVEWQSIGEVDIRITRRIDGKVIAEFNKKKIKPLKQGDTRGQEAAHLRCMRELGKIVATKIVHISEFKKKKK